MSSAGGGLAQLLLMLAAARRQAILGRRSAAEELANKRADREMRQQELQLRVDQGKRQQEQADREAAMARAKPFIDAIYGPNSADTLASLQQNKLLGGFIPRAEEALAAAGMPSDLSHLYTAAGIQKTSTPGHVDTGFQSFNPEAGPLPPALTSLLANQPVTAPATSGFVPAMETVPQAPLSVPAPARISTPRQSINPASLGPQPYQGLSLGNLLPAATPAGPVNVPMPDITRPITPPEILPTWKTQLGQQKGKTAAEEAQSKAAFRNEKIAELQALREPTVAKLWAQADELDARGDLSGAEQKRVEAQTATEAFKQKYLTAQTGLAGAQAAAVPAKVAETGRHNLATEANTRRGQDIRSQIAAANRAQKDRTISAKLPLGAAPFLQRFASLGTAQMRTSTGSRPLTDEERAMEADRINADATAALGVPLTGPGGLLGGVAPATPARTAPPATGGKAVTGALLNQVQQPQAAPTAPRQKLSNEQRARFITILMSRGMSKADAQRIAAQHR